MKLDSRIQIALITYFLCVALTLCIFGGLRLASTDKLLQADIRIINTLESSDQAHHYTAKLIFSNPIFRAHKDAVAITIHSIEWDLAKAPSFTRQSPDSNRLELTTQAPLELGSDIGTLTYSTKILATPLQAALQCLSFALLLWLMIIFIQRVASLNALYPKSTFTTSKFSWGGGHTSLAPLTRRDKAFLCASFGLIVGLFVFQLWLGFPGFHIIGDTYGSIALIKDNWHPVFIPYVLELLYTLFGKHLYYLYLWNLVPFYLGLLFLVWGFYLRFRSLWALGLLFPIFVGNIYFQNFVQYHSFALPMLLFCAYSMVLFALLVPVRFPRLLWGAIFVVLFFALLWRHNAIFSVFPISFVLVYVWLQDRGLDPKTFARSFGKGIVLAAIICLSIATIVPKLLTKGVAYPTNATLLHQIAGACVPADDASCFKQEWYLPNKGWEDVKALYTSNLLYADVFNVPWAHDDLRPIPHGKIEGLKRQWILAIVKHPINFLAHEMRFLKAMWIQAPGWIFDSAKLQEKPTHPWHIEATKDFPKNEQSITLSPLQTKIYDFLYTHKLMFNHIYGVLLSLFVLLACFVLWIYTPKMRSPLLLFSFSAAFAGFFSALFIVAFTPVTETRYMSPVLPLGIVACIGLVAALLHTKSIYQALSSK